jgi:hypothetical protein
MPRPPFLKSCGSDGIRIDNAACRVVCRAAWDRWPPSPLRPTSSSCRRTTGRSSARLPSPPSHHRWGSGLQQGQQLIEEVEQFHSSATGIFIFIFAVRGSALVSVRIRIQLLPQCGSGSREQTQYGSGSRRAESLRIRIYNTVFILFLII